MKNRILLFALVLCMGIITTGVFASSQVYSITVDIPKLGGSYTSSQVSKDYSTNQKVYHIGTISNHNGDYTNIKARLYNVDYDSYSQWVELGTGDDHTYSGAYSNTGNYKIQIKNAFLSIYTYYSCSNWQYSI